MNTGMCVSTNKLFHLKIQEGKVVESNGAQGDGLGGLFYIAYCERVKSPACTCI